MQNIIYRADMVTLVFVRYEFNQETPKKYFQRKFEIGTRYPKVRSHERCLLIEQQ